MESVDDLLKFDRHNWHEVSDVASIVLEYCGPDDLRSIAQTNKMLNELSCDDELWIRLLAMEFAYRYKSMRKPPPPSAGARAKQKWEIDKAAGLSAKETFRGEWVKPRKRLITALRRMKDFTTLQGYYTGMTEVDGVQSDLDQFQDMQSFFDEASEAFHHRAAKLTIPSQLKTLGLCAVAALGVAAARDSSALNSYALKSLNDSFLSHLVIPPLLLASTVVVDTSTEYIFAGMLLRFLGAIAVFAGTVFLALATRWTTGLPFLLPLVFGLLQLTGASFIANFTTWTFRAVIGWLIVGDTVILVSDRLQRKQYQRRDAHRVLGSVLLTCGVMIGFRFTFMDTFRMMSSIGYLGTLQFIPLPGVTAGSGASITSPFLLFSSPRLGWNEALGYYVFANVLTRCGLVRLTTKLYSSRWELNTALSLLFDACTTRVLVDEGIGPATAIRCLCTLTYIVAAG